MAESTFEAIVFLLGSRSATAAWAGAANPLESGSLLAQPLSSAPARISIAPRNSMTSPPRQRSAHGQLTGSRAHDKPKKCRFHPSPVGKGQGEARSIRSATGEEGGHAVPGL